MEDWDGSAEFLRSARFGDVEKETCGFPGTDKIKNPDPGKMWERLLAQRFCVMSYL